MASPISQAAVLPKALRGSDICGSAVTGSGKTAAFLLPCLERLLHVPRRIAATRVLVLCPTRELAAQCDEMGRQLSRFTDLRFCLVVGGLSVKMQETEMRQRPDIVVATPGRLVDLLRNCASVGLDMLEVLVLDEADRLLELGFKAEVEEIISSCPRSRQTLLFSATISSEVASVANVALNRPLQVKIDTLNNVADTLQQEFVRLRPQKEHEREAILLSLVSRTYLQRVIVFLSSKVHAHRIKILFGLSGLTAAELHGNLTQQQRLQAVEDFRDGKVTTTAATPPRRYPAARAQASSRPPNLTIVPGLCHCGQSPTFLRVRLPILPTLLIPTALTLLATLTTLHHGRSTSC